MTVEIPPEHQAFVKDAIARGEFGSETEVVGEAIRLLEERERRLAALCPEIQVGLDQLDRGDCTEYDENSLKEFFEQLKAEGAKDARGRGERSMNRLWIAREAKSDIQEIWAYVAKDRPAAADRLINRIYETLRLVASQPLMGEARDELGRGLRSLSVGEYVVIFRPTGRGVEAVRIVHGARDVRGLF